MARKRNRDVIDWIAVAENFGGLKMIIHDATPQQLVDQGVVKAVMDKIGLDAWLATLSSKERKELKARIQASGK